MDASFVFSSVASILAFSSSSYPIEEQSSPQLAHAFEYDGQTWIARQNIWLALDLPPRWVENLPFNRNSSLFCDELKNERLVVLMRFMPPDFSISFPFSYTRICSRSLVNASVTSIAHSVRLFREICAILYWQWRGYGMRFMCAKQRKTGLVEINKLTMQKIQFNTSGWLGDGDKIDKTDLYYSPPFCSACGQFLWHGSRSRAYHATLPMIPGLAS